MRVFKWIAGVAVGLLLLTILAVAAITLLIEPNRFKGRIEAAVQAATGDPFKIDGDLHIAWYPWLAVQTGPAQLGDPSLARWESARVGVRLTALLHGELVIDRIRVDGLSLQLRRRADGRANWDRLRAHQQSAEASTASVAEIGGLELRHGALEYLDDREETYAKLSAWSLDMGSWKSGESVSLRTDFMLQYPRRDAPPIPVTLNIPQIRMQTSPVALSIPAFESRLSSATFKGRVAIDRIAPLQAAGALSIEAESLRDLLTALGVGGPRPRDAATLGRFKLATPWSVDDEVIRIKPIQIRLDQTHFSGEATCGRAENSVWTFDLRGDRIQLDRYAPLAQRDQERMELPIRTLRALRAQGSLSFDAAEMAGAQMKSVRLRLEMADGQWRSAAP